MPRRAPLPDQAATDLIRIYERAHRVLLNQVQRAVLTGAVGTERQRRLQMAAVLLILTKLRRETRARVNRAVSDPYGAAAMAVDMTAGFTDRGFAFGGVHDRAVRVGVAALNRHLGDAITQVGRSVDDVFRQVQLEHAAVGIAAGDARRDVSRRMAADLRARGIPAFYDRRGRRWSLETYSRMTVRTNTREMVTTAVVNRLVEAGDDLVQMSDHDTDTPLCERYEGRVFSLRGRERGYPRLDRFPPLHPGCLHYLTPAAATFDAFEKALRSAEPPEWRPLVPLVSR